MREPGIRRGIRRLLRSLVRRPERAPEETDAEIRFHLAARVEQLMQLGVPAAEARAEALRRFGGSWDGTAAARRRLGAAAVQREERLRMRDQIDAFRQDVRYALRGLRSNPGVTTAIVLTLALGIGANTAMFSVVSAVLLRPLPYGDASRVVEVWNHWTGWPTTWLSEPEAADYVNARDAVESFAPFSFASLNLTGGTEPQRLRAGLTAAPVFATLGVTPVLGRTFTVEEDRPNGPNAVVLTNELWQRRFGRDSGIVGRRIELDANPYTVVGVLPSGFRLPIEFVGDRSDIYLPLQLGPPAENNRGSHYLNAVARLRSGVTLETAQRQMTAFVERMKADHPNSYGPEFGVTLVPVAKQAFGDVRPVLLVLLGAVTFVLLIGCVNVASLLLSRAESRQREMAVRAAIGAGRSRIVRQLLTESLVLAVFGGVVGLGLATVGIRALEVLKPANLPRAEGVGIDPGVLLFTLGVSLVTGIIFGLAPALHAVNADLHQALKQGRGTTADPRKLRVRHLLVTAEVALAVVSATGAALMTRSFAALVRTPPGFRTDHALTMRLAIPQAKYARNSAVRTFYGQLLDGIRQIPGVRAAGAVGALPLGSTIGDWGFRIDGRNPPGPGERSPAADWQVVVPGYFEAIGIPLLRGRTIGNDDRWDARPVIVISKATADRYWPGLNPVGQRLRLGGRADTVWREVVGVVGDVKHNGLDKETRTTMYLPHAQFPSSAPDTVPAAVQGLTLVVRTAGDPVQATGAVRSLLHGMDPDVPLAQVRTLDEVFSNSVSTPRLATVLLTVFGVLSLALAAIGIYGVMTYTVARNTGEIGVRMALGARSGDVLRLTLLRGMRPAVAGLAVGTIGAFAATRLMRKFLYGVSPTDAVSFAVALAILATVGVVATLLPARRASRIDPLEALRTE